MKYPRDSDIKEHKDRVWTSMVQYVSGYIPLQNVETIFKSLLGDAILWVNNNHKKLDIEKMKELIVNIKITGEKRIEEAITPKEAS